MSDYKKQVLERVSKAAEKRTESARTAFDESATKARRLEAFNNIGAISEQQMADSALALINDTDADADLRTAALDKITHYIGDDQSRLDQLAMLLSDLNTPDKLREAALRTIQANSFSSAAFLAQRPNFLGTLRALIDDKNDNIRESAIEYLALNGDEYVQRRLLAGLQSPGKKITKPELAVQYLAYDLHADHFPILRKLAANPPNKKTRMEALRNLGADPSSQKLMETTFKDKKEDPEVRHVCGVALNRINASSFERISASILRAKTEHQELKVALLNTQLHQPGAEVPVLSKNLTKVKNAAKGKAKSQGQRLSTLMSSRSKS